MIKIFGGISLVRDHSLLAATGKTMLQKKCCYFFHNLHLTWFNIICYFAPVQLCFWLEQSTIFTSTWFSSAQTSFSTKFLVNFATRFAELIQFWQGPKCRRNRTFWRKSLVFHWRKISYFVFIYIFLLVLLFISSFQIYIYIYIYIYNLNLKTLKIWKFLIMWHKNYAIYNAISPKFYP